MHGTADSVVPSAGGFLNVPLPGGQYFSTLRVFAINDVIYDWRESNGCVGEPVITQLPDLNTQDSSTVKLVHYEDCECYPTAAGDEHSAEVLYYMIEGGGHTWPGGGTLTGFGPTNRDINASAEIWNFFNRHEFPAAASAWGIDADAPWSQGTNWNNGIVRHTADAQAVFGAAITQPRTVNLDLPVTVGRIDFANINGYTVVGSNSITLDVSGGIAEINVTRGSHTISAPVILADNAVVGVWSAASSLLITEGLNAANVNLVKAGVGILTVNQLRAARLTINGGKVVMAPNGTDDGTSLVGALHITGGATPTAKFDLTNNAAVINYTGTSPVARCGSRFWPAAAARVWAKLGTEKASPAARPRRPSRSRARSAMPRTPRCHSARIRRSGGSLWTVPRCSWPTRARAMRTSTVWSMTTT
jgi:hypothetical protein